MKGEREARESRIASGWIVEGDPDPIALATAASADPVAPASEPGLDGVASGAGDLAADGPMVDAPAARTQMSTGMLILLGVLGGVYLLYTWVWFSWASYYSSLNAVVAEGSGSLGAIMQQIVFWAAPLAPILWFVSVLVVVGASRSRAVMIWLLVGVIVLVPLPMLSGGA